ncbi:hypothetical protein ACP4OV_001797 [Aristida adscensionis]
MEAMDATYLPEASSPTVIPRLLSADVDMDCFTGEPEGSGWSRIECRRSIAYGCGARGQAVVDGLALYLRLGHHPDITSSLAIRMSDTAVRAIRTERGLAAASRDADERELQYGATVLAAHDDLVVVVLSFGAGLSHLA